MTDIVGILRKESAFHGVGADCDLKAAADEIERLRSALQFYAKHGAGCRLIHRGGDASRNALAEDGGKRAQFALSESKEA
jgi:hypothetical protein